MSEKLGAERLPIFLFDLVSSYEMRAPYVENSQYRMRKPPRGTPFAIFRSMHWATRILSLLIMLTATAQSFGQTASPLLTQDEEIRYLETEMLYQEANIQTNESRLRREQVGGHISGLTLTLASAF